MARNIFCLKRCAMRKVLRRMHNQFSDSFDFFLRYGIVFFIDAARGGHGPLPKPESQGAKLSFGPRPPIRGIYIFFSSNIHNTLLFIVYLIWREGNSHVTFYHRNVRL